jgi:nudix-type nucleoside diphosphatase (YffH/AdpP family)
MPAEIAGRTLVYDGWYRLERVTIRHDDGSVVERHIEDHGSAVAVLPYDPARGTVLVISLPRAPIIDAGSDDILEAIAGNIASSDPETCARREALEEAGVRLGTLEPIANVWTMPALSTERLQLYLARYGVEDLIAAGGGHVEEGEHITVREVPIALLATELGTGRLTDPKLVMLLQALLLKSLSPVDR